ncbi:MAG: hypothetical protein HZB13_03480 [Acidobacteria bacterium]|nr:hypothetical protein [Acidobacteriota bacterium]
MSEPFFTGCSTVLHAVEQHRALAVQHVIQLRAALVVVQFGAVDVHRVRPGGYAGTLVLAADQPVPPAATGAFARRVALVADQYRACAHAFLPPMTSSTRE